MRDTASLASFLYARHRVASVFALHAPDAEGDLRNCHGHMVFTSRNENEEIEEWKLSFAFFF